jgi:signal transduction histidine kinase
VVKITDKGRGIPPGYEQKIFERFQQVNSQDAREKKGTGLGLAICKAIIDAHNGAIGVKSREGDGSTFWFRVPKQKQALALVK